MARIRRTDGIGRLVAGRRERIVAACVLALACAALVVGIVVWQSRPVRSGARSVVGGEAAVAASVATTASVTAEATLTEVPDLIGEDLSQAEVVLQAAGFSVAVEYTGEPGVPGVQLQRPEPGAVLDRGATVTLVLAPQAAPKPSALDGVVVCIDPGHQSRSDSKPEPVGPGSAETKPRVTGGATGLVTEIPEYEIALQISMNLKARLESSGLTVVMTRTTNDVSLSNAERARIANESGADLFVRIHGDGNPDSRVCGISTLYPASNAWTAATAAKSKQAATLVQHSVVKATGAADRGLSLRGDIAGFNWAKMPSILVECGFLSNSVEDRLLASPHYQDKLAQGIAEGVLAYLEGER